jgi:hypothetical protein
MIAAIISVRTPSGAVRSFEADRVAIENGIVTASGRWRRTRDRRRRHYTWPRHQLVEIRWLREPVTA